MKHRLLRCAHRGSHAAFAAVAGIMVMAALGSLAACSPNVPEVIKIGVAQPLSGPFASLGRDMLQGVDLAVKEINDTHPRIGGRAVRLQMVVQDDRSDPATGETVARKLVEERVVGVIGHLNSGVSIAAAPIYGAAHIPQLSISTQPAFTELGLPTTLRLVASDTMQARAIGAYAATLPGQDYAVIDDGSSYGISLAQLAARAIEGRGKRVTLRRSVDDKTSDFESLIAVLRRSPTTTVISTLNDSQVMALIAQLKTAGLTQIRIVGGDTIKTDRLLAQPLPVTVFAASPVLEPSEFYRGRGFVTSFRASYGNAPLYGAHYAYDAVHMLMTAIERTESVDGATLTAKLRNLDFVAPITNTMKFGSDGEQLYGSVGIYRPRDGRWEPIMNSDRW